MPKKTKDEDKAKDTTQPVLVDKLEAKRIKEAFIVKQRKATGR